MPGALDQYLQDYQKYVEKGRAVGIKAKKELVPPPKPALEPEEKAVVEKLEAEIEKKPLPVIPVTFDSEAFHAQVLLKVKPKYTVENPCTIAYQASDLGLVTLAYSLEEVRGYGDYLLALYEGAFAWKWGYGYQQALDEVGKPGCPSCPKEMVVCGGFWSLEGKALNMGTAFYVVLTQLETIMRVRGKFLDYAGHTTWQQVKRLFPAGPTLKNVLHVTEM